jgi:hypothetical protein
MATKKKAKKAAKKSTARARKAAPSRKAAKKRAAAARAPKRAVRAAARKPAKAKAKAVAKPKAKAVAKPKAKAMIAKPKAKTVAKPAVRRRDRAGHIDPKYGRALRRLSEPPERDPESFIEDARASDDLSEEMGEEVVATATTGEYEAEDVREQDVPEEVGGPFVETSAREEFGHGTDPSNPKGATREPFPRT